MLTLLRRSCNPFDTMNEQILIYNKRKAIARKKGKKLKIKFIYIFANTIIIEHMFIIDALYYESLQ